MTCNKLKLNADKTDFLIFHSKFRPMSLLPSITVGNEIIQPKGKARNIGVTFDTTLTMSYHVNDVVKGTLHPQNKCRS